MKLEYVFSFFRSLLWPTRSKLIRRYREQNYYLLHRIVNNPFGISGFIDSTKSPGRLLCLCRTNLVRPHVIFLYRDLRVFAFSRQKVQARLDVKNKTSHAKSLLSSIIAYNLINIQSFVVCLFVICKFNCLHITCLKYEELCSQPESSFDQIVEKIVANQITTYDLIKKPETRGLIHVLNGNRVSLLNPATISLDETWKKEMNWVVKLALKLCALPSLALIHLLKQLLKVSA